MHAFEHIQRIENVLYQARNSQKINPSPPTQSTTPPVSNPRPVLRPQTVNRPSPEPQRRSSDKLFDGH